MNVGQNDIKENEIKALNPKILSILLRDKTTRKNIIWATEDYNSYGEGYGFSDEITSELITGERGNIIKPRVEKTKEEQSSRSKEKAEVFTPSWICNKQNNLIDWRNINAEKHVPKKSKKLFFQCIRKTLKYIK